MRYIIAATFALLLTGCKDDCVDAGGHYELVYMVPISMGNGITAMSPIYNCEVP